MLDSRAFATTIDEYIDFVIVKDRFIDFHVVEDGYILILLNRVIYSFEMKIITKFSTRNSFKYVKSKTRALCSAFC